MRLIIATLITVGLLPAQIRISAGNLSATFDPSNGYGLSELREMRSGRSFLAGSVRMPLYRITLSNANGSAFDIDSAAASDASASPNGKAVTPTFRHAKQNLSVVCTIGPDTTDSRLTWRLSIYNSGKFGVRSLFYPQWPAPLELSPTGNRLLYPFLDGQEFVDPGSNMPEH